MPKSPPGHLNTVTHTNISTQYRHYTMLTYLAISIPWSIPAQVQHNNADGCKKRPGGLQGQGVPGASCPVQHAASDGFFLALATWQPAKD